MRSRVLPTDLQLWMDGLVYVEHAGDGHHHIILPLAHHLHTSVRSYKQPGALEGAVHLLTQLAALALVIHIFLLPPVLFVEQTQTPLYL
jgi:hypothetical protein